MQNWQVKFLDTNAGIEEITAVGYKLAHDGLVLSFFDDRGFEVFGAGLQQVQYWRPLTPAPAPAPGMRPVAGGPGAGQSPVGGSPYHPGAPDPRQSIEAQTAASMQQGGPPRVPENAAR